MKRIQKLLCFYEHMLCIYNISCLLTFIQIYKWVLFLVAAWKGRVLGVGDMSQAHHMYHSPSPDTVRTIYSIYPSILILIVWKLSSPIRIVNIVGVRIVQILQFCSSVLYVIHAASESTMDLAMGNNLFPSSPFIASDDEKIEMKSTGHMQEDLLDSQLEIFRTGVER